MYPTQDTAPSCLQLVATPVVFSSSQVPPFAQLPNVPPEIAKYMASLAVLAGNELGRQAKINPAFTYLFNVVASSGYQGQTWQQIVSFATAFLWFSARNKQGVSIESLLQEAAATTIILKASFTACGNSIVFGNLDPATQNQAREFAQQHERLRPVFEQLTAEYARQLAFATNPAAMSAAYGGIVGASLHAQPVAPTDNPYGVAHSGIQDPTMPIITQTRLGGLDMLKPLGAPTTVKRVDAFSVYQGVEPSAPEPVLEASKPIAATVAHISSEKVTVRPVATTIATRPWVPIDGQWYKPAYHNEFYKLVYEDTQTNTGKHIVLATVNLKDDKEMEQAKHKVPALSRAMSAAFEERNKRTAGDAIVSDLDLIVAAANSQKSKDSPDLVKKLDQFGVDISSGGFDSNVVATTDTVIAAVNEVKRSKLVTESVGSVYYAQGRIAKTIITGVGEEALYGWDKTQTGGIRAYIKGLTEKANDASTSVEFNYINALNRNVTKVVNDFLKIKLGIDARIDTAIEDFETVLRAIGTDFGGVYKAVFEKWCESNASMRFIEDSCYVELMSELPQDLEKVAELVVGNEQVFYEDIGVVLLEMSSDEFGIDFSDTKIFELFPTNFPGLQPFLATVLNLKSDDIDVIYINTLDDKLFGVSRSALGDKPVVIFEV